ISSQRGFVTVRFDPPPPPPLPQLGARIASRIRLPIDLFFTAPLVLHPGQDEQQVRKPVDVLNDDRWHGNLAGQRDDATLRPAAHGAGEMEEGGPLRAAAEDEALEGRELAVV